jgi:predicted nucleic acid-binding protein
VPRATFLADTSVFARLSKPAVAAAVSPLIAEGHVAVCAPVAFELGFGARNATDHDALLSGLDAFETLTCESHGKANCHRVGIIVL